MLDKHDLNEIREKLESFDLRREKILTACREATRLSDWAIIQLHRDDIGQADATLKKARAALDRMEKDLKTSPELKQFGNVIVAYQEFVEAKLLFHLMKDGALPSLKKLGMESTPYLLGLLDFIGELRRMALNNLRRGRVKEAEQILDMMEGIYEDLVSLDHTAIIPTFRRKTDAVRRIIENTRGDVITDLRRLSLERSIKKLEKEISRYNMKK